MKNDLTEDIKRLLQWNTSTTEWQYSGLYSAGVDELDEIVGVEIADD